MRSIAAAVLCLSLVLRTGASLAQELDLPVLGQAEALVRAGQPEQAWQLLAPLERRYAGRQDFDYLLGVAALESGRPNRATFVLERVIALNPQHLAARLEMARAYFALRDFERAKREFNSILNSGPPPDIDSVSRLYLARMREAAQPAAAGLSGYAEVTLGHDTNVNAAVAQSSVFVPGLGTEFFPDPMSQRRPDDFLALGAGLEYARALRGDLGLVAGADVRQRWHSSVDLFDTRAAELQAGLLHRLDERSALQYSARYSHYDLDNAPYRETQSLGAQWSRRLSLRTRIAVAAEGHRIRYRSGAVKASSSDLLAASVGVTHVLQPATLTTADGSLYFGNDQAVAGRVDGDRRIRGASLGLQRRFFQRVDGYVRFSLLESGYETQNPDFGVTRRDRQRDAALGMSWEFADRWLLRPQIARTVNHSNLPLNEYRRTESSITLRRVWD